jgi:hypothetical protein
MRCSDEVLTALGMAEGVARLLAQRLEAEARPAGSPRAAAAQQQQSRRVPAGSPGKTTPRGRTDAAKPGPDGGRRCCVLVLDRKVYQRSS